VPRCTLRDSAVIPHREMLLRKFHETVLQNRRRTSRRRARNSINQNRFFKLFSREISLTSDVEIEF
jgi:hypothetical protein